MIRRFTKLWLLGGLTATALLLPQANLRAEDEKKPTGPDPAALFKQLDKNNDGQLTEDEIPDEQQRLFKRLVRNADKNNDGKLTAAEFAEGLKNDQPRRPLEQPINPALAGGQGGGTEADAIFKRLDANNDGKVTLEEVPEEAKDKFRGAIERGDTDKDGTLTLAEFRAVMGQAPAANPNTPPTRPGNPQGGAEAMFKYLDANNDGILKPEEIPEPRRENFKNALEKLDSGSKGGLNLEEFRKLYAMMNPQGGAPGQPGQPGGRPGLEAMFKAMDKNADGKVTPDEVPEERRENFTRMLERGDTNNDGGLDKEEYAKVFGNMPGAPGTPQQGRPEVGQIAKRLLEQQDTNKDGKLSKDEAGERMKEHFEQLDANSDGFLDEAEITKMLSQFGPNRPDGNPQGANRPESGQYLKRLLEERDTNKDGKLSKDEVGERLKENFEKLDANGDGFLDETELAKMFGNFRPGAGNPEGRKRPDGDNKPKE